LTDITKGRFNSVVQVAKIDFAVAWVLAEVAAAIVAVE